MQKYLKLLSSKKSMEFINKLGDFFKKAPHLPNSWTKFLAKIMPWLALVGGICSILGGLSSMSLRQSRFGYGYMDGMLSISPVYFILIGLLSIITGSLLLMAFKDLKAKKEQGWILIFYSSLVGIVSNLLGIFFAYSGVLGFVITAVISLWISFEIRKEFEKN